MPRHSAANRRDPAMTYLIISDTHGCTDDAEDLIRRTPCDRIIHLGDLCRDAERLETIFPNKSICILAGNNDYFSDKPRQVVLTDGDIKIFCTHGHMQGVKSSAAGILRAAEANRCGAALFGHTHRACKETHNGILLLNPGSITFGGTYAVLNIKNNSISAEIRTL